MNNKNMYVQLNNMIKSDAELEHIGSEEQESAVRAAVFSSVYREQLTKAYLECRLFDEYVQIREEILNTTIESTPGTFRAWLLDTLVDDDGEPDKYHSIIDLANHGADGGFRGLTYTRECVELYNQYEYEIWEALREDAQDLGYDSAVELITTFQRKDMLDNPDTFKNLLVWYMAERVSRKITDELS